MSPSEQRRRVASRSSDTAEINAAQRAAEWRRRPDRRIVDDPFARYFVRRPLYRALSAPGLWRVGLHWLDSRYPGLNAIILGRGAYAHHIITEQVRSGVTQAVLLGAGYDSTALRIEQPELAIYEVDAPTTQAAKHALLAARGLSPRTRVEYVSCDLECESPGGRLIESGFSSEDRCVVTWLGVSYYLSREAFGHTLADIASFSSPGSCVLLDYMDGCVLAGDAAPPEARRLAQAVARRGEPYTLGFSRAGVEQAARAAGFVVRDHLRIPDLARWSHPNGVWCRTEDFFGLLVLERAGGPPGSGG